MAPFNLNWSRNGSTALSDSLSTSPSRRSSNMLAQGCGRMRDATRPRPNDRGLRGDEVRQLVSMPAISDLRRRRVDDGRDLVDRVAREAAALGVLANGRRLVCDVDAEELVVGHVRLEPLGPSGQTVDHLDGLLGKRLQ